MGLILGRFRKKKSTLEQLEKIDADIQSIEAFRLNTEVAQRRIVGQFILVSAGIYVIVAVVFYFYFFPATFYDQLFYITPLLLVPFIIWGVKRLLTWYYRRKISQNESKLSNLRFEKKKLLDHVMDTETYKIAKNILEKFAPDQIKKSTVSLEVTPYKTSVSSITSSNISTPSTVRSRTLITKPTTTSLVGIPKTPAVGLTAMSSTRFATPARPGTNGQQDTGALSVRRPTSEMSPIMALPREIIPRDRSILDKMVEYLVGDGPGNRYALICKKCFAHNGMALPEEFEYFAFRCCYCYSFNPARKLRPSAPKLEIEASLFPSERRRISTNSTSSSEKNSGSDTEIEENDPKEEEVFATSSNTQVDSPTTSKEVEEIFNKTDEEKKTD